MTFTRPTKYNPLTKSKGVNADVANTLGLEVAMGFLRRYHNEGDTGEEREYDTEHGKVVVSSTDDAVNIRWADEQEN